MFRNWVSAILGGLVCVGVLFAQEDLSKCTVDPTTDLAGLTQTALASEWGDTNRLQHTLEAFRLLTMPGQLHNFLDVDSKSALQELKKGARAQSTPTDADLYQAASALPDFLDWVATANTLVRDKAKSGCVDHLLAAAKPLIDKIFMTASDPAIPDSKSGAQKIIEINDLFTQKNNYAALYCLLSAFPKDPYHNDAYPKGLEILRAAFAADPDRLAKLVSDKISAPE
jgi:hypothetical protein